MINQMANALQAFGENRGYDLTSDYYKKLCWTGSLRYLTPEDFSITYCESELVYYVLNEVIRIEIAHRNNETFNFWNGTGYITIQREGNEISENIPCEN